MMLSRLTTFCASLTLTVCLAGSAHAVGVIGWDFSQYVGSGFLSTDGATFTDTLSGNYSNLDPTGNAGAESATYGTLYMDGSFGSTDVDESSATSAVAPLTGSLDSNIEFSDVPGTNPFDSSNILLAEGQDFANELSLTMRDTVSLVFEADLTSLPDLARAWTLEFGAKTFLDTASIDIEFSVDGASYVNVGTVDVDELDTEYVVDLRLAPSDRGFVRMNFDAPIGEQSGQVILDNVTINAEFGAPQVPSVGAAGIMALVALLSAAGLANGRQQQVG